MSSLKTFGFAVVAGCIALLATACANSDLSSPPALHETLRTTGPALQHPQSRGIEDAFLEIEKTVPGFGGFSMNSDGDVVLFVVDDALRPAAEGAVRSWLELNTDVFQRAKSANLIVRKGQYAFSDLVSWHTKILRAATESDEVTGIDADEGLNRVRLLVRTSDALARVPSFADRLGIPRDAIAAEVSDPIVTQTTLTTDSHRPTASGFLIEYKYHSSPDSIEGCSIGYNVTVNGSRYILTASHCNVAFTGGTGQNWHQSNAFVSGDFVGTTAINPAWSTSCPATVTWCRD